MTHHKIAHRVSFGDCDPAGIVYYPRFFEWFDRAFHDWLRQFGGHQDLCVRLGSIGLGLMSVDAAFRSPARDGDDLSIRIATLEWSQSSLGLNYEIACGERLVAAGREKRGVFLVQDGRMIADNMLRLKDIVDGGD
ncbi:MAG: acyl-CoA thioesterase [Roseovarius sp.]